MSKPPEEGRQTVEEALGPPTRRSPRPARQSMGVGRRHLVQALRVTVSLFLLVVVYRRVQLREFTLLLASARPELLLIPLAQLYMNTALSAYKWKLFLRADGIRVPFMRLMNTYLVGGFVSLFLPSNIGGDAYRVVDIARRSRRTEGSFASVLADRISGFLALFVLGLACTVIGLRFLPNAPVVLIPLAGMLCLGLVVALAFEQRLLLATLGWGPFARIPKLASFTEKLLASVAEYRRAPGLLGAAMAISVLFHVSVVVSVFMLSRALNLDIPLPAFFVFLPLISLVEALPVSIYGLGVRDASYVLFFTQVGVARVEALALALGYVLLTFAYSLLGGLILVVRLLGFTPRTGRRAPSTS